MLDFLGGIAETTLDFLGGIEETTHTFLTLWLPSLPDDNPLLEYTRLGSLLRAAAQLP